MKFQRHIPTFVEQREPQPLVEFSSLDELLAINSVAQWKSGLHGLPFHRFSLSGNELMAEFGEGEAWWVVGFVEDAHSLELPRWYPPA